VNAVGDSAIVSIQNPILLPPRNEPQPDIAILRPRADYYESQLPLAEDVLLIIEVADTTLDYDRDVKIPIYAQHGIVEAWLVDIQAKTLSLFLDPAPTGYRKQLHAATGDRVVPRLLTTVNIAVGEIFP
jgi:hypothetical protein